MADDGADDSEGDDGHDDERLGVGFERNGQEDVDAEDGEEATDGEVADGFILIVLFSLEAMDDTGEFFRHLR